MSKMRKLVLLSLVWAVSGCVNLGLGGDKDSLPIIYYVMEDAGRSIPDSAPASLTLLMADTEAGAFYDTDDVAFSDKSGTRGYYLFARWTERPGKRFADLLLGRLERDKVFAAVAQSGSNTRGDWLLTTEILELYHDAVKQPGMVRMELRAEVVDLESRSLLARKTFIQSAPASSYDAAGAHKAFNEAVTRTLDEMSDWLKKLSAKPDL